MKTSPTKAAALACSLIALAALLVTPGVAVAQKPSAIEGQVNDQQDQPLQDVAVTVTRADDPDFQVKDKTNRKGRFTVRLPAGGGTYQLRFEKEGFDLYEAPVEVETGMAHDITFRMAPEGTSSTAQAAQAYNAGVEAYKAGDQAGAKEKFLAAAELAPELPQPHVYLADIYLKEGEVEEAAAAIERYLPSDPDNAPIWRLAFDIYRAQGDGAGVERAVAKIQGSEVAEALAARTYNEGVEKNQAGDVEGAVADFQLALELAPGLTAIHSGLAALQLNRGSYAAAVAAAERLLAIKPEDPQGRRIRYLALAAQKDPGADAALAAWGEVAPEAATALLYQQGEEAFRQDRLADAIADLERLLRIAPEMARAHYTLGLAYTSAGEVAKAKEHLRRFVELAPDDPEAATARELLAGL